MRDSEKNKSKKQKLIEKIEAFCQKTEETFLEAIDRDGVIGSIGEIYDTKSPYASKGTTAQGWSVAEVYRIMLRM